MADTPQTARRGCLVLMPNTLDLGSGREAPLNAVLPQGAIERAAGLTHWVVENAKTARAFLKRVDTLSPLISPIQAIHITELPRPAKGAYQAQPGTAAWDLLLQPTQQGHDLGLLSEAGMPAVADPGSELVARAHALGITVEPWSGPSSLVLALAASGLGGQNFAFVGYLPVDATARGQRIRELEQLSRRSGQTQMAIETPYRNAALMSALLTYLQSGTRLSIACGLTLDGGWCRTAPVSQWRERQLVFDDKMPAVFAWRWSS
jgi:16S rRNA (cytidine1402-2'-O)-methyltransferase